ncbi:MAG: DUF2298 domain-containing protein [Anaerolineales bacterium]
MIQILIWWLLIQILGWLSLPIAMRIFRWLPDNGYSFSKALGLLLISYFLWIGASTGFLNNDLGGILFSFLIVALISVWFIFRSKTLLFNDLREFLHNKWKIIVTVEVLFTFAFVGWALFRAYVPYKIEPAGGEKFMETAFQNAILRSDTFPPIDPWFSWFGISYYYFGYVMLALLTRVSGSISGIAFDLYDSLLFALTLIGSFGVVYNLVKFTLQVRHKESGISPREGPPIAAGLMGSLLVVVMSNLEGVLESLHAKGILPVSFWNWIDIPGLAKDSVIGSWYPGNIFLWWWRASRVLADKNLLGKDFSQPIDEFPFFSFMLGDNHPHVLALPFVLLAIGLAFNLYVYHGTKDVSSFNDTSVSSKWWNPIAFAFNNDWLFFIFSGLILGALGFLNTWDLPIYLALVVLVYVLAQVITRGCIDYQIIIRCIFVGLGLIFLSILLYIFFYISFSSQASGLLPYIFPPTRLPQYLVMFGTFIFLLTCYIAVSLHKQSDDKVRSWKTAFNWWWRILLVCIGLYLVIFLLVAFILFILNPAPTSTLAATISSVLGGMSIRDAFLASINARIHNPWLLIFVSTLLAMAIANIEVIVRKKSDLGKAQEENGLAPNRTNADPFVYLLIIIGLSLTLIVEFFYLRDSFGVRMNTVFKFYYQGWVMMGLASAYGIWWLLDRLKNRVGQIAFATSATIFVALGLVYTIMAIPSRAGEFTGPANLDGASGIAQANPDDWAAIQWLNANAENGLPVGNVPVILEAPSFPLLINGQIIGGSYTYAGRISTFTGLPTILGWSSHEGQWRGSYDEQEKRESDIATIYTASNKQAALDLLHKWNVKYVILGQSENDYIRNVCSQTGYSCSINIALRKFDQMLEPVFSQGQTKIYRVP